MVALVLFSLIWAAEPTYSCRALVVLGVYNSKAECEKARQEKLKEYPTARCVQCQ
jgi:hypothetical protein